MTTIQIRADQCYPGTTLVVYGKSIVVEGIRVAVLNRENPNDSTVAIKTDSGESLHPAHALIEIEYNG